MTKHTPGPWKLGPSLGEVRDDDDNVLCDVYHDNDEQAEADAYLIAAAPELLAACERLLMSADASWRGRDVGHDWDVACDEAVKAIAKARGQG
jgi:hypothetical protein